jgi:hypothetical protein
MLRPLWRDGDRYSKVGVLLDELRDAEAEPSGAPSMRNNSERIRPTAALCASRRAGSSGLRAQMPVHTLMMAVGRAMAEDTNEGDLTDFLRNPLIG